MLAAAIFLLVATRASAEVAATAVLNSDYATTAGGVLSFSGPGTASATVAVLIDDSTPEAPKDFTVTLTSCRVGLDTPVSAASGIVTARVVILDDDVTPYSVSFAQAASNAAEGTNLVVTVLKAGGNPLVPVSTIVHYTLVQGTATLDEDVAALTGSITIGATETSKAFNVPIVDDDVPEGPETFTISLTLDPSTAGYATLTPGAMTVTIPTNDDAAGVFGFAPGSLLVSVAPPSVGSDPRSVNLEVTRTRGTVGAAAVFWFIGEDGADTAFAVASGTINFADGQDTGTIDLGVEPSSSAHFVKPFTVQLLPRAGSADPDTSTADVQIEATGFPNGVVGFDLTRSYRGSEDSFLGFVSLRITRQGGTTGRVGVWYVVRDGQDDFVSTTAPILLQDGQDSVEVDIGVLDDSLAELAEEFDVALTNPSGGVRIDPQRATTKMTIEKSDDPNGVVSVAAGSQAISVAEPAAGETQLVLVNVTRTGGTLGDITALWTVTGPAGQSDVSPASGSVAFADGSRSATITLAVGADDQPELAETFTLSLDSVEGGARVAGTGAEATIVVRTNDDSIEFAGDGAAVFVDEEAGVVVVSLTRGGDRDDTATVRWRTVDGTAAAGSDFVAVAAGEVVFAPDEIEKTIQVTILDDPEPEFVETFRVQLLSVTGDAVISPTDTVNITIRASDDATGVFGFEAASLNVNVTEGEVPADVRLRVNRTKSPDARTFGDIAVTWTITGEGAEADFLSTSGTLQFAAGVAVMDLVLQVRPDAAPEIAEEFEVTLSVGPEARLDADSSRAVVTISANDKPHGEVRLRAGAEPAVATDGVSRWLHVPLSRVFGLAGDVEVTYRATYTEASGLVDALPSVGTLVFAEGQSSTDARVAINDDALLSVDGRFSLILTAVRVVGDLAGTAGAITLPPVLGENVTATMDTPEEAVVGTLLFAPVSEDQSFDEPETGTVAVRLLVRRAGGTFSDATVRWAVSAISSDTDANDLSPLAGEVTIAHGASQGEISIEVRADDTPELKEIATVALTQVVAGTVVMPGTVPVANIKIRQNDNPFGTFRFAPASVGPIEVDEAAPQGAPNIVALDVLRDDGLLGVAIVTFTLTPDVSDQLTTSSTRLLFREGVARQQIFLQPIDDNVPELALSFVVSLTVESKEANLGAEHNATVIIRQNDDANGIVDWSPLTRVSSPANELADRTEEVTFVLTRARGLFGELTVPFALSLCDPSLVDCGDVANQGDASTDMAPAVGSVTFADGADVATFHVEVVQDSVPEDDEVFAIQLGTPLQGRLADDVAPRRIVVFANDDPIGFEAVAIPTSEDAGTIDLVVTRGGRASGRAEVNYVTADVPQRNPSGLAPGYLPVQGALVFADGERTKTITITLVPDDVPQPDLHFEVRLSQSVQPGDSVIPEATATATVTVLANDDAGGVFGFEAGSLSAATEEVATSVLLNVSRSRGAFAEVSVEWSLDRGCSADFVADRGVLDFGQGVAQQVLSLAVVDDSIPELQETCTVSLTQVSTSSFGLGTGRIAAAADTATVVIAPSDDPRGVFTLRNHSLGIIANEDAQAPGNAFTITLERLGGTFGEVSVAWNVTRVPFAGVTVTAPVTDDLTADSGVATFAEGEAEATIVLTLLDDLRPELQHEYEFSLGQPVGGGRLDADHSAIQLTSEISDDPYGLFEFPAAAVSVNESEANSSVTLTVLRGMGTNGRISLQWRIATCQSCDAAQGGACTDCAEPDSADVTPTSGTIVFEEGATDGTFTLTVLADTQPELEERRLIQLSPVDLGRVGAQGSTTIVLADDDHPYGLFSLEHASDGGREPVSVQEVGGLALPFAIVREGGSFGTVEVTVDAIAGTADASDYVAPSRIVTFAPGETRRVVSVLIAADDVPEVDEVFAVGITAAGQGGLVSGLSVPIPVTILENDDARGVIGFGPASTQVLVDESPGGGQAGQPFLLRLERARGVFGSVSVAWRVEPQGVHEELDVTGGVVEFAEGASTASIAISVLPDSLPEQAEQFTVALFNPLGGAALASDDVATVTIRGSDDPHGVFNFRINQHRVVEPDAGALTVTLVIDREGGFQGVVTLYYQTTVAGAGAAAASAGADYTGINETAIVFQPGDRSHSVFVDVLADDLPEIAEAFSVVLTRTVLDQDGGPYDSPSPALGARRAAVITIAENDDARGIFELQGAGTGVSVIENSAAQQPFLRVVRSRGLFGEVNVTFQARVPAGCASGCAAPGLDYAPELGVVRFAEGQSSAAVPLTVVDDNVPELTERFEVVLLSVSGGGLLADAALLTTLVTLPENDDPHGVIEVGAGSRLVVIDEPADGGEVSFEVEVVRQAGTIGEVTVDYSINDAAGRDVSPTSGSVFFADGQQRASITVRVLADDVPELDEVFTLSLDALDGSARFNTGAVASVITVRANDDPHGVFEFASQSVSPSVEEAAGVISLTVQRQRGTIGRVQLDYTVTETPSNEVFGRLLVFNLNDSPDPIVLDLFNPPVEGSLATSTLAVQPGTTSAQSCLQVCFLRPECRSANYNSVQDLCVLNRGVQGASALRPSEGTSYYERRVDTDALLRRRLASLDADFAPIQPTTVIFEDGQDSAVINVTILQDQTPELNEMFTVKLASVTGINTPSLATQSPVLGKQSRQTSTVTIEENQDPNGVIAFDPAASSTSVPEEDGAAVSLVIRRSGGLLGAVVVIWSAALPLGSGGDLASLAGEVIFDDGEDVKTVSVAVVNDVAPELDERVLFTLAVKSGGASTGLRSIHVVLLGNDDASGVFSVVSQPRQVAEEDGPLFITIARSVSLLARVTVDWTLEYENPVTGLLEDASADFVVASGRVTFVQDQASANVAIQVVDDDVGELAEGFVFRISGTDSAATSVDLAKDRVQVVVTPSDDPYGVVQVAQDSRDIVANEGVLANITFERTQGSFAAIEVFFRSEANAKAGVLPATSGSDFLAVDTSVVIPAGSSSVTVAVDIIDDLTPEVFEGFSVSIVSVRLSDGTAAVVDGSPRLSPTASLLTSFVTINANDDASGVFHFEMDAMRQEEADATVTVAVIREGGSIGAATVPVQAIGGTGNSGAQAGIDFTFQPTTLSFADGEERQTFTFSVLDDAIPELDEAFTVSLLTPSRGRLADPSTLTVVIASSDDAGGLFQFDAGVEALTVVEGGADVVVSLPVLRTRGLFGDVTLSYTIRSLAAGGGDAAADFANASGTIVFPAATVRQTLNLRMLADDVPELEEQFEVVLALVEGPGARLGPIARAVLTVPENDDPRGVLAFDVATATASEEDASGAVTVSVSRSAGSLGEVSARWAATGSGGRAAAAAKTSTTFSLPATTYAAAALQELPRQDGVWSTVNDEHGVAMLAIHTLAKASQVYSVAGGSSLSPVGATIAHEEGARWAGTAAPTAWLAVLVSPNQDAEAFLYTTGQGLRKVQTLRARASAVVAFQHGAEGAAHVLVGLADAAEASTLYRWDGDGGQLTAVATAALRGPNGLTAFRVGGDTFVAAAVVDPDKEPASSSTVYKVDGDSLTAVSSTLTSGAQAWTVAQLSDGEATLALSSDAGVQLFGFVDGQLVAPAVLTAVRARSLAVLGGRGASSSEAAVVVVATMTGEPTLFKVENASAAGATNINAATLNLAAVAASPVASWATLDHTGSLIASHLSGSQPEDAGSAVLRLVPLESTGDFGPTSGTVVFPEGSTVQTITVNVFDDTIPELSETFALTLVEASLTGGVRLDPAGASVLVSVEANDDPAGVIGFAPESQSLVTVESVANRPVTFKVLRSAGANGAASVAWSIVEEGVQDVSPTSGSVSFADGQADASFVVVINADTEPEVGERFTLRLDSVQGGARLEDASRTATLTIRGNDDIHGVVAVSLPPVTADAMPLPENTGVVQVVFSRTLGTVGDVQIEYELRPVGPSGAEPGNDTASASGSAVLFDGVRSTTGLIAIVDDQVPEDAESFSVVVTSVLLLFADEAAAADSPRIDESSNSVDLMIAASDDASGVFGFASSATDVEESGVNGSAAVVEVVVERQAGAFGTVSVLWELSGDATVGADFVVPSARLLTFGPGVLQQSIRFTVVDDNIPEVSEMIVLSLVSISGGVAGSAPTLSSSTGSQINILANDDIRGRFGFLADSLFEGVDEGVPVQLSVRRTRGMQDDVVVRWSIRPAGAVIGDPADDFVSLAGELFFPADDDTGRVQTIAIQVTDDMTPELEEAYEVVLTVAEQGASIDEAAAVASIVISASDDANGVFGVDTASSSAVVQESPDGVSKASIVVARRGGTQGSVTLNWAVTSLCVPDTPGDLCGRTLTQALDFAASQPLSGALTFADGQVSATIELEVVNDVLPEGDEATTVQLSLGAGEAITGGLDSDASSFTFVIAANDDGNGVFTFASESRNVDVDEGAAVALTIRRTLASFGEVTLTYELRSPTSDPASDDLLLTSVPATVTFGDGEVSKTISVEAFDDQLPEQAEDFTVVLTAASGGGRIASGIVATVSVSPSDNPSGVFGVADAVIALADAGSGTPAGTRDLSFSVSRTAGTFNSVSVVYSVKLQSEVSTDVRRQLVDAVCSGCRLVLAQGEVGRVAQVRFPPTIHLEAGESLQVELVSVSIFNGPASPHPGDVPTIDPSLATTTAAVNAGVANNAVTVSPVTSTVNEGDSVEIVVSRGSEQGTMTATWSLVSRPGQTVDDISPPSGSLRLGPGVVSATIVLSILNDAEPEGATRYSLQLADVAVSQDAAPLAVVLRSTTARINIAENDNARGVFAFGSQAARLAGLLNEETNSEVALQVVRTAGAVGAARVIVRLPENEDVSVTNARAPPEIAGGDPPTDLYVVDFVGGQRSGDVVLRVRNDALPELRETFPLSLVSVSTRDLAATSEPVLADSGALVTLAVAESDDPHGIVGFVKAGQRVNEADGTVRMAVVRLGGRLGAVTIRWTTSPASGVIDSDASAAGEDGDGSGDGLAPDGAAVDFDGGTGLLEFDDGVDLVFLTLRLRDDDLPEPDEAFSISLSPDRGGASVDPSKAEHAVTISANDNPRGVIGFAVARQRVEESSGTVRIVLQRTGGLFGTAAVQWSIGVPQGSAFDLSKDIQGSLTGQAAFRGNATEAVVSLQLRADLLPELDEDFIVLLADPSAGASLGARTVTRVTVAANEDPRGVLGFSCQQSAGVAIDGRVGGTVTLSVLRTGGAIGEVAVLVETTDLGTADATNDFVPASTLLTFADGETAKDFAFETRALAEGAASQTIIVSLRPGSVTGGASVNPRRVSSVVTLYDNTLTETIVQQISLAVCEPTAAAWCPLCQEVDEGGVDNVVVAGPGGSTGENETPRFSQAHVDGIIRALQQLVPGSGSADEEVRALIDSLFDDVINPDNLAEGVDQFEPLPELIDQYAAEVLESIGGAAGLCPGIARREVGSFITIEMRVVSSGVELNGLTARSSQPAPAVNHTYRLPKELFDPELSGPALAALACTQVLSIDFRANTWWPVRGSYELVDERALAASVIEGDFEPGNGKVVGILPPAGGTISTADPLSFTIPMDADILPGHLEDAVCAWWDAAAQEGLGGWTSSGCVRVTLDGQRPGEVSCSCNHATQFGVIVPRVTKRRLTIPAILALVLLAVAALIVMVAHMLHSRFRTDNLALVLQLFLTIFLTAVFGLITVLAANNVSKDGCAALGLILHFFFVSQFAWVIAISVNLYMVLVSLQSDLSKHFGKLMVLGWGLPLLTVLVYIIVSVTAYGHPFSGGTYGDITGSSELCLIPQRMIGGWGGAVGGPVALAFLCGLLVILGSRRHRSEWLTYDDLYFGRPNVVEVRVIFGLLALLLLTWAWFLLAVFVHAVAFGAIFLVFAVVLAVYMIYFYAFGISRTATPKEQPTSDKTMVSPPATVTRPRHPPISPLNAVGPPSGAGDRGRASGGSPATPMSLQYAGAGASSPLAGLNTPPAFDRSHMGPAFSEFSEYDAMADMERKSPRQPQSPEGGEEDFNDLIFALKTGSFGHIPEAVEGEAEAEVSLRPKRTGGLAADESFDLRRISIMDTHL